MSSINSFEYELLYKSKVTKFTKYIDIYRFTPLCNDIISIIKKYDVVNYKLLKMICIHGNINLLRYLHDNRYRVIYNTLIYYAAIHDNLDIVKYLHSIGLDFAKVKYNPLYGAAEYGNLETIKYLYENGINDKKLVKQAILIAQDYRSSKHTEIIKYLQIKCPEVRAYKKRRRRDYAARVYYHMMDGYAVYKKRYKARYNKFTDEENYSSDSLTRNIELHTTYSDYYTSDSYSDYDT
jgi:hypothetical protein